MPTEALGTDRLRAWQQRTDAALAELTRTFLATHGFPPGENTVPPATTDSRAAARALAARALAARTPLPADLAAFYEVVAEASLPDVHHGYFVHPPELVADHLRAYGPVQVGGGEHRRAGVRRRRRRPALRDRCLRPGLEVRKRLLVQ
ncbi:hypothetical protein [Kitasatospora sp. NPDC004272]